MHMQRLLDAGLVFILILPWNTSKIMYIQSFTTKGSKDNSLKGLSIQHNPDGIFKGETLREYAQRMHTEKLLSTQIQNEMVL